MIFPKISKIDEIVYILKRRDLVNYFSEIYGAPKTKKLIVSYILHQGNYNPAECLYIGDAMSDYYAAQKGGVKFLGIVKKGSKSPFLKSVKISSHVALEFA